MFEVLLIDAVLLFLVALTALAAVSVRNLVASVMMLAIYSLLMALVWVNMDAVDVAFTEAAVGAGISTILLLGALVLAGNREAKQRPIHWPALIAVVLTGAALVYGTVDMPSFGDPDAPVHRHPIARAFTEQNIAKRDAAHPVPLDELERAFIEKHDDGHDDGHGHDEHGDSHSEPHAHDAHDDHAHVPALTEDGFRDDGHEAHGGGHHHRDDYFHGHVANMVTAVIVSYRAYDTMFETAVIFTAGLGLILLLRGRRGRAESGGLL